MGSIVKHLINGKKVSENEDRYQDIFNPATGEVSGQVALASAATVEEAIAAAAAAFPSWRDTTPAKRAQVMFRYKELLEKHADEIDRLLTLEQGKVLADSHGEFLRALEVVEYMCGVPELLKGEHSKNVGPGIDSWSERQALGVCAGITPFNFPVLVPMWMFIPAIACGNTIVLKPSEKDPSSTLKLVELLSEAGLPDGVVNIVNGDKEAVDTLLTDPRIQAVSFVGSTPVAEYIYTTGCANGKRVQALGGGKNHAIIMPDADLENAVSAMMGAAFGSCGERCMAVPVAVAVGDEVGDAFVEKIKTEIAAIRVGPGTVAGNDMGPLVTKPHFEKVRGYVDLGVEEGAEHAVVAADQQQRRSGAVEAAEAARSLEVLVTADEQPGPLPEVLLLERVEGRVDVAAGGNRRQRGEALRRPLPLPLVVHLRADARRPGGLIHRASLSRIGRSRHADPPPQSN